MDYTDNFILIKVNYLHFWFDFMALYDSKYWTIGLISRVFTNGL